MAESTQSTMDGISRTEPNFKTTEVTWTEQPDDGLQLYHRQVLDELPGAAFAAATLVWIISSFGRLAW
jgi:hypothetical protein